MQASAELVLVNATSDKRAVRRRVVSLSAYAREAKANIREVQVFDLSTDGCRIGDAEDLDEGCEVWLKIPGIGAKRARVAWRRGQEAGCEFLSPVEAHIMDQLLSSAKRSAQTRGKRLARRLRGLA